MRFATYLRNQGSDDAKGKATAVGKGTHDEKVLQLIFSTSLLCSNVEPYINTTNAKPLKFIIFILQSLQIFSLLMFTSTRRRSPQPSTIPWPTSILHRPTRPYFPKN
jgi:hypothetical protein